MGCRLCRCTESDTTEVTKSSSSSSIQLMMGEIKEVEGRSKREGIYVYMELIHYVL